MPMPPLASPTGPGPLDPTLARIPFNTNKPVPHGVPYQGNSETATSSYTRNSDGSLRYSITPGPSHVQDASGAWHDIDLSLLPDPDGRHVHGRMTPAETPVLATDASASDAVSVPTGDGPILISHPGARAGGGAMVRRSDASGVEPATPENSYALRFSGALPGGADVAERLMVGGFEETAVMPTPSSASYDDQWRLPVGWTAKQTDLGVELDDASGKVFGTFANGLAHEGVSEALCKRLGLSGSPW